MKLSFSKSPNSKGLALCAHRSTTATVFIRRLVTGILTPGLPTSSAHRIVAVDAMQPTASGVSMRWRCCDAASMVIVAGLWTSPAPSQLIFVQIHWLLHSAASIDSALRAIRCGDIVAAPEEKRRSHSADIAGIDSASSASLARLGHVQVLSRQ